MKNYQKGFIAPVVWGIVALLVIGLGGYVLINQQTKAPVANQVENTVATTKGDSVVNAKTTGSQNTSASSTSNTKDTAYQDGRISGLIKSVNKDSSGKTTLGIDIVQPSSGKEAFLAMAEDFENGTNKMGDWTLAKDRFKTFTELSKYVKTLSESQFEDFYYSYQKVAFEKPLMGIFGAFPNGIMYIRNVSPQIRYYPVDNGLKQIKISGPGSLIDIEDLYYACTVSEEKWGEFLNIKRYDSPYSCDNQIILKVSRGVIKDIEIIYRP